MSCLFSKGMAEDKAKTALKARVVDSFMATDEKALDVNRFELEERWIKSVMSRLAIVVLRWCFGLSVREFEVLTEQRKGNAGFERMLKEC